MKGRHVQMANFACAEFRDKWPNLPKTEMLLMNVLFWKKTGLSSIYVHKCKRGIFSLNNEWQWKYVHVQTTYEKTSS